LCKDWIFWISEFFNFWWGSWKFANVMNVGNLYLRTFSLQQTSLGLLGFLDVLKTLKAVSSFVI
jgi:hypothetical protein